VIACRLKKKAIIGKYIKPGRNQKKKDLVGQESEKLKTKQIYSNFRSRKTRK